MHQLLRMSKKCHTENAANLHLALDRCRNEPAAAALM
jgi:hypothetical protein